MGECMPLEIEDKLVPMRLVLCVDPFSSVSLFAAELLPDLGLWDKPVNAFFIDDILSSYDCAEKLQQ